MNEIEHPNKHYEAVCRFLDKHGARSEVWSSAEWLLRGSEEADKHLAGDVVLLLEVLDGLNCALIRAVSPKAIDCLVFPAYEEATVLLAQAKANEPLSLAELEAARKKHRYTNAPLPDNMTP